MTATVVRQAENGLTFNGVPMWAKLTALLGFPIVACAALGMAGWAAASWTANHVIEPAMKSHVATLEKITATQDRLADSFELTSKTLVAIKDELQELRKDSPKND